MTLMEESGENRGKRHITFLLSLSVVSSPLFLSFTPLAHCPPALQRLSDAVFFAACPPRP